MDISPKTAALINKQNNQSSNFTVYTHSETSYSKITQQGATVTGDNQNKKNSQTKLPEQSVLPSSYSQGATSNNSPAMCTTSISYLEKLIALKKEHVSVKILFPITNNRAMGALSQTTLSPQPTDKSSKWGDSNFVQLPYDPCNTKTKVETKSGNKTQVKKWDIIKDELAKLKSLENPLDFGDKLRSSITNYNATKGKSPFELLKVPEISLRLKPLFEFIVEEAAKMEHNFPFGIPVLRENVQGTIFINQKQISSILANAFLCTFPKQGQQLPEINFHELFTGTLGTNEADMKAEKLKCILHYFKRIKEEIQGEGRILSFERRIMREEPNWEYSKHKMSRVAILKDGCIENSKNCLQVDFANQFVGGGVLGRGMVMEEIRFSICPELIVARLFTEKLEKNEVLVITGCEQFCKYTGYGKSFKYGGNFVDTVQLDDYGRKKTEIVAMDAYNFSEQDPKKQFGSHLVKRELNKSYCAFLASKNQDKTPIATGNWGCGIFNGDPQLKFIIQWMAASQAGRELHYYTVGDEQQGNKIMQIVKFLCRKNITVGNLLVEIERYNRKEIDDRNPKSLFSFLESDRMAWL